MSHATIAAGTGGVDFTKNRAPQVCQKTWLQVVSSYSGGNGVKWYEGMCVIGVERARTNVAAVNNHLRWNFAEDIAQNTLHPIPSQRHSDVNVADLGPTFIDSRRAVDL